MTLLYPPLFCIPINSSLISFISTLFIPFLCCSSSLISPLLLSLISPHPSSPSYTASHCTALPCTTDQQLGRGGGKIILLLDDDKAGLAAVVRICTKVSQCVCVSVSVCMCVCVRDCVRVSMYACVCISNLYTLVHTSTPSSSPSSCSFLFALLFLSLFFFLLSLNMPTLLCLSLLCLSLLYLSYCIGDSSRAGSPCRSPYSVLQEGFSRCHTDARRVLLFTRGEGRR